MSALPGPSRIGERLVVKKPIDLGLLLRIVHEHCCGQRGPAPDSKDVERATPTGS
jgi:hypothetical protein